MHAEPCRRLGSIDAGTALKPHQRFAIPPSSAAKPRQAARCRKTYTKATCCSRVRASGPACSREFEAANSCKNSEGGLVLQPHGPLYVSNADDSMAGPNGPASTQATFRPPGVRSRPCSLSQRPVKVDGRKGNIQPSAGMACTAEDMTVELLVVLASNLQGVLPLQFGANITVSV